ncbi:ATP-binding protein [Sphingomonas radiodurans]|uniref:ATP-binding protein n=1 Tax=Sphingomonas radiodurans TaxID=2890321 RepID=UPI001E619A3A|nr:ATP-binding protein [Sphingomonas radiodurans]WBH16856.1 ATP-binding protein [Sphingomonas radiodurans]
MGEIISPRGWIAMMIVVITAGIVGWLGAALDAAALTLVGGAAAVLATTAGREPRAEPAPLPPSTPPPAPLDLVLDALNEPVLILNGARVAIANRAARGLLGTHVLGEDARIAIRHPAAAALLAGSGEADPVALGGLGAPDQRWEMRVAPIGDGRRLVHLADRSGSHAAERMRVDFVANASHELRTPLASILGYVETLADEAGEDPALRARFLKIVFDEARRMERLVDDLMSLSRIEAEKFRAPAESVDLAALIDRTREELADAHDGRGHDIILEHETTSVPMLGDATQLSQLLHNLVGNAMKYGRPGTPIRVSLTREGDTLRLVVADQGDGIAPEHLPRLTERFYRVDPGRSRSIGGTGLGLAIVKHIVERHRGRLDIASRPGEGTRVTVTLRAPGATFGLIPAATAASPLADVIKQ